MDLCRRFFQVFALFVVAGGLLAGCSLLGKKLPENAEALPELPKAVRVVGNQDVLYFHGSVFKIGLIERDETGLWVHWIRTRDRVSTAHQTRVNGFTRSGDFLVGFEEGPEGQSRLVLGKFYFLPALIGREGMADSGVEELEFEEGSIRFFPGGYASVGEVMENDYSRMDEESAFVLVSLNDRVTSRVVDEFHSYRLPGGYFLRVQDIYPGERPNRGLVRLDLVPGDLRGAGATALNDLVLDPGEERVLSGLVLTADAFVDETGSPAVYVRSKLSEGSDPHGHVLEEGESVRLGSVELTALEFEAGGPVRLGVLEYPHSKWPFNGRVPGVLRQSTSAEAERPRGEAPTIVTRTLSLNETVEFYGARVKLNGVNEVDRSNVNDDMGDFTASYDQLYSNFLLREGHSHTIHGKERWWTMEIKSVESLGSWGGEAVVRFRTGTYLQN